MNLFVVINDAHSLIWAMIGLLFLAGILLMVVFFIHRKNSYHRFELFEQRIHEFVGLSVKQMNTEKSASGNERNGEEIKPEADAFKKALYNHMKELNQRIASNEEHTHRLANQIEALTRLIASLDEENETHNTAIDQPVDEKPEN